LKKSRGTEDRVHDERLVEFGCVNFNYVAIGVEDVDLRETRRCMRLQAELLQRVEDMDPQQVRKAAAEQPGDAQAQIAAADLDLVGGHVEDAFGRLVDAVRRTAGDERDAVRVRLLELFDVVGSDDPRVTAARRALARALF